MVKIRSTDAADGALSRRAMLAQSAAVAAVLAMPGILRASTLDRESALRGRTAVPDRHYLDAALAAERWIARSRIADATGVRWPADPVQPGTTPTNLYSGSAGVVLFYLELHAATKRPAFRDEAARGADALVAGMPTDVSALGDDGAGLYTGVAGTVYALERTHAATGDAKYLRHARRGLRLLHDAQRARTDGAWNNSNDIVSGTSGIGLTMLWARRTLGDAAAATAAQRAARHLVSVGLPQPVGTKWEIQPGFPRRYPNFSHGTAGVAFFLASVYEHSHAAPMREAAIAGAQYLQSIAVATQGGGQRVMHSEPGGEQLFYMSWCHGPAGTARLFHQLGLVTRDARWSDFVPTLARGIVDSGVPELHPERSGFWNNISQCCGNCGVSEFFLAMYRLSRDEAHLAFVRRVMDDTIARGTADGDGMKWTQAENRTAPGQLIAQTGMMQGAAGVGLALLHLDGALHARRAAITLPDTPAW